MSIEINCEVCLKPLKCGDMPRTTNQNISLHRFMVCPNCGHHNYVGNKEVKIVRRIST